MPVASPPRASAVTPITLALAMSAAVSCVPSNDLDTYHSAAGETTDALPLEPGALASGGAAGGSASVSGGSGELPPTPSLDPPVPGVGSATGSSSNGDAGGSGAGSGGGEPLLSLPDAGPSPPPADAASASTCAAEELTGPNGHCYFFQSIPLAWDAARSACLGRGTGWDLVSVRSAADSAFLGDTLTFEAWLGASDAASEGTWLWVVDDQPFWVGSGATGNAVAGAYVNWNTDEPNGVTPDCARALPRSFGSLNPDAPWADLGCELLLGAICERYPAL
jgi:hypothetical protein